MGNNQNKTTKLTPSATTTAAAAPAPGRSGTPVPTASPVPSSSQVVQPSPAAMKLDHGFSSVLNLLPFSGKTTLDEEDFTNYIFATIPCVGKLVYWYLSSLDSEGNSVASLDKLTYIDGGTNILSISSAEDQIKFYVNLFATGKDTISDTDMKALLTVSQQVAWMSTGLHISLAELSVSHTEAMIKSLFKGDSSVSASDVNSWSIKLCPDFTSCLHTYTCSCLVGKKELFPIKETSNEFIQMLQEGHSVVNLSSVWMLTLLLPPKYFPSISMNSLAPLSNLITVVQHSAWHTLYNSNSQGLSVSRFQHLVMDYLGPTLLFIKFDHYLYAVAIDTQWIESSRHWGDGDGMFFEIQPNCRLIQSGSGMMYLNLSDRSLPKGFHVGRDARTTFLKVDDAFDKVSHYGVDFKLAAIEVWGCGGQECFHKFCKQKQWEHKEVTKHQNRKLTPGDWKENPDRAILEMGGVTTEHNQRTDI